MKKLSYFLISFLIVVLLSGCVHAIAQVAVPGADIEVPMGKKIFGFLKDINALNIALIAFGTFAGGLWAMGRSKMKQIGEIFLKAYDYTDDKKLTAEERNDLIQRFLAIMGKSSIVQDENKRFILKKK